MANPFMYQALEIDGSMWLIAAIVGTVIVLRNADVIGEPVRASDVKKISLQTYQELVS